jgi:IclR family pca regulon transcriptional regulator
LNRLKDFVQSLDRGLAIIRVFDVDHPQLTLSEVARTAGINRASARRCLHTLLDLGYVRSDGPRFALSPKVLDLGYPQLGNLPLAEVATPHLRRLADNVHESCSVSVLDNGEIVYVARAPTRRIMRAAVSVGMRLPAYATALGRVLLAGQSDDCLDAYLATTSLRPITPKTMTDARQLRVELVRVRSDGHAVVDEELEEGLRSIAAPIRNRDRRVVAAINVSAHISCGTANAMRERVLDPLLETAAAIQDDIRNITL